MTSPSKHRHDNDDADDDNNYNNTFLFELLKELPFEILHEKILYQYCDGKSLSTLALTLLMATKGPTNGGGDDKNNDDDDIKQKPKQQVSDVEQRRRINNRSIRIMKHKEENNHDMLSLASSISVNNDNIDQADNNNNNNNNRKSDFDNNCNTDNDTQKDFFCYHSLALDVIPKIGQRRLLNMVEIIQENQNKTGASYADNVILWIQTFVSTTYEKITSFCVVLGEKTRNRKNEINSNIIIINNEEEMQQHLRILPANSSSEKTIATKYDVIRYLSEMMVVLDFVECSINEYSNIDSGQFEWPVWFGNITLDIIVTTSSTTSAAEASAATPIQHSRVRNTASVVITAPITDVPASSCCLPAGARYMIQNHHTPTQIFHCEPHNLLPTLPWGKIRGLTITDHHTLQPIISQLYETNQIAMPNEYHLHHSDCDTLDIRIITQKQAYERRQQTRHLDTIYGGNMNRFRSWNPPRSTTDWILGTTTTNSNNENINNNNNDLICCWQSPDEDVYDDIYGDKTENTVKWMTDLLKVKGRLLSLQQQQKQRA